MGGKGIPKTFILKILTFLCVAIFFVSSLNAFIQPAMSGSDDLNNLHIISGTGDFSAISQDRTITVSPGQEIKGYITLAAHNTFPGSWVVPLIRTPSWGDKTSSWQLIKDWLPTGDSTQETSIDITAPKEPGTYYFIFAFSCEMSGDQVASATDWHAGQDVWDDGNDMADLNSTQVWEAQQNSLLPIIWLSADGYSPAWTPIDAIDIIVSGTATGTASQTAVQSPTVSVVPSVPVTPAQIAPPDVPPLPPAVPTPLSVSAVPIVSVLPAVTVSPTVSISPTMTQNPTVIISPVAVQKPAVVFSDTDELLLTAIVIFAFFVLAIVGALFVIFYVLGKPSNMPKTSGPGTSQKMKIPEKLQNADIANKLKALQSQREKGMITDQEYDDKKREILEKL